MRAELVLVSVGGEPCDHCDDTVDYSFKVKDGCIERCADKISELVFGAMADGDISVAEQSKRVVRPVAWRVKDFADGWIIFQDEAAAHHEAEVTGALMQGLYVRDGT